MGASASVELGSVQSLVDALRSNTAEGLLGVRRCSRWTVTVNGSASGALALAPTSCTISGRSRGGAARSPTDTEDLFRTMTAEEQANVDAEVNRQLQDYEDCSVELTVREDPVGEAVLTELVRALASNCTVEGLFVYTDTCSSHMIAEFAHSLTRNSTLRRLELEVGEYIDVESGVAEKVQDAIAQTGCLHHLSIVHGVQFAEREYDLSAGMSDALLRNRCAAEIAMQLGLVCRLDEIPGSRAKFKCASFRLCLLSYWLSPLALPPDVKARAIRRPLV